jgi:hypothetical protein
VVASGKCPYLAAGRVGDAVDAELSTLWRLVEGNSLLPAVRDRLNALGNPRKSLVRSRMASARMPQLIVADDVAPDRHDGLVKYLIAVDYTRPDPAAMKKPNLEFLLVRCYVIRTTRWEIRWPAGCSPPRRTSPARHL